jgi:hypothetical protein
VGRSQDAVFVLRKFNRDMWRRVLPRAAIVFGVLITFVWMAFLAYGFVAVISWAI